MRVLGAPRVGAGACTRGCVAPPLFLPPRPGDLIAHSCCALTPPPLTLHSPRGGGGHPHARTPPVEWVDPPLHFFKGHTHTFLSIPESGGGGYWGAISSWCPQIPLSRSGMGLARWGKGNMGGLPPHFRPHQPSPRDVGGSPTEQGGGQPCQHGPEQQGPLCSQPRASSQPQTTPLPPPTPPRVGGGPPHITISPPYLAWGPPLRQGMLCPTVQTPRWGGGHPDVSPPHTLHPSWV